MTDFIDEEDTVVYREMVQELLDIDEGLYEGEIDFLDSMHTEWEGNFTDRQAKWIKKIYERIFG